MAVQGAAQTAQHPIEVRPQACLQPPADARQLCQPIDGAAQVLPVDQTAALQQRQARLAETLDLPGADGLVLQLPAQPALLELADRRRHPRAGDGGGALIHPWQVRERLQKAAVPCEQGPPPLLQRNGRLSHPRRRLLGETSQLLEGLLAPFQLVVVARQPAHPGAQGVDPGLQRPPVDQAPGRSGLAHHFTQPRLQLLQPLPQVEPLPGQPLAAAHLSLQLLEKAAVAVLQRRAGRCRERLGRPAPGRRTGEGAQGLAHLPVQGAPRARHAAGVVVMGRAPAGHHLAVQLLQQHHPLRRRGALRQACSRSAGAETALEGPMQPLGDLQGGRPERARAQPRCGGDRVRVEPAADPGRHLQVRLLGVEGVVVGVVVQQQLVDHHRQGKDVGSGGPPGQGEVAADQLRGGVRRPAHRAVVAAPAGGLDLEAVGVEQDRPTGGAAAGQRPLLEQHVLRVEITDHHPVALHQRHRFGQPQRRQHGIAPGVAGELADLHNVEKPGGGEGAARVEPAHGVPGQFLPLPGPDAVHKVLREGGQVAALRLQLLEGPELAGIGVPHQLHGHRLPADAGGVDLSLASGADAAAGVHRQGEGLAGIGMEGPLHRFGPVRRRSPGCGRHR